MDAPVHPPTAPQIAALTQVGALPIRLKDGKAQVLLLTSRGTRRWVIPKGWPMKGKKNWAAAAQEAKEEAGVIGRTAKQPVGEFLYFKRRASHYDLCRVEVYPLHYEKKLAVFREKGQREMRWFSLDEAMERVDETGLSAMLRDLDVGALFLTHGKRKAKPKRGAKG